MSQAPLLSVLVPTYEHASLLRVMLETLLPQAADCAPLVEVCIADNASTDDTAHVVAEACKASPRAMVSYVRRERNVGPVRNYVLCATEQAQGQFIWALGDDDLLVPGALERICAALHTHRDIRFFYVNFALASFAEHWPATAASGYGGPVTRLACDYPHDRHVHRWQDLLDDRTNLGTQVYAHIVARDVWCRFWRGRVLPPDYRALETTYPHTAMLISEAWDKPARFLAGTHTVQFDGRSGWGEGQSSRIYLVGFPSLIARLDDRGIGLHTLLRSRQLMQTYAFHEFRKALCEGGGPGAGEVVADAMALSARYPELVAAFVSALKDPGGRLVPEVVEAARDALVRIRAESSVAIN